MEMSDPERSPPSWWTEELDDILKKAMVKIETDYAKFSGTAINRLKLYLVEISSGWPRDHEDDEIAHIFSLANLGYDPAIPRQPSPVNRFRTLNTDPRPEPTKEEIGRLRDFDINFLLPRIRSVVGGDEKSLQHPRWHELFDFYKYEEDLLFCGRCTLIPDMRYTIIWDKSSEQPRCAECGNFKWLYKFSKKRHFPDAWKDRKELKYLYTKSLERKSSEPPDEDWVKRAKDLMERSGLALGWRSTVFEVGERPSFSQNEYQTPENTFPTEDFLLQPT